jgi:hypothetical protein
MPRYCIAVGNETRVVGEVALRGVDGTDSTLRNLNQQLIFIEKTYNHRQNITYKKTPDDKWDIKVSHCVPERGPVRLKDLQQQLHYPGSA